MYLWMNATPNSKSKMIGNTIPNIGLADLWINKCLKDRLTTIRTTKAKGRIKSEMISKAYNNGIKG